MPHKKNYEITLRHTEIMIFSTLGYSTQNEKKVILGYRLLIINILLINFFFDYLCMFNLYHTIY